MSDSFIQFQGVHKSLEGQEVLSGVDLEIPKGESFVLLGTSGGGKSVLMRHIVGLMKPSKGEILIAGKEIDSKERLAEVRRQFCLVFQNGALFDSMSVEENLAFALYENGIRGEELKKRVSDSLKAVNLENQEKKFPSSLSGGMVKRVALARAIALHPECLLLDEPTAGLDPFTANLIIRLIAKIHQIYQTTNIIITHDIHCISALADRVAFLKEGKIHWSGKKEDFFTSEDEIVKRYLKSASLNLPKPSLNA